MSASIGSGLIAVSALLALGTVLFGPEDLAQVGTTERLRQVRNAGLATFCASIAGFAGAVLVLVGSEWVWALAAAAAVALAYYLILVSVTHLRQRHILAAVLRDRALDHDAAGLPGRITLMTAADLGLVPDYGAVSHFFGPARDARAVEDAARAEALAWRRARLLWAIRYPYGRERPSPLVRLLAWVRIVRSSHS